MVLVVLPIPMFPEINQSFKTDQQWSDCSYIIQERVNGTDWSEETVAEQGLLFLAFLLNTSSRSTLKSNLHAPKNTCVYNLHTCKYTGGIKRLIFFISSPTSLRSSPEPKARR